MLRKKWFYGIFGIINMKLFLAFQFPHKPTKSNKFFMNREFKFDFQPLDKNSVN